MTQAVVREIDGQLVLDDPDALAMIRVVAKHNCKNTLELNAERVRHFSGRIAARQLSPAEFLIVILNVDDAHGGAIAEALMPGHDWSEFWARGEIPFARGLAGRGGIHDVIAEFDVEAAAKLRASPDTLMVVVVDHGVAEVYPAAEVGDGT